MATILRTPVFSSYPGKKGQPVDVVPNLLLSTLALVTVTVPLGPVPFDTLRPRMASVQMDPTPMPLLLRQSPAQKLPVGTNGFDEFAQPRLRPLQLQDTNAPNILVRDLPPSASPPTVVRDTTQSIQPRGGQDTNVGNLLTSTLGLGPGPFLPADTWQIGPVWHAQDTQQFNVLLRTRVPAQLLPIGANGEDFTQVLRRPAAQADSIPNLLTTTLSVQQQVFPPGERPDGSQWRVQIAPQDTVPTVNLLANQMTPGPFIPADTSQLVLGTRAQDTESQNALLRLLPPGTIQAPFGQDDWTQSTRWVVQQIDLWPNVLLRTSTPAQILPVGVNGYDELAQPRLIYRPQDTTAANALIRISTPGQIPPPVVPVDWVQRRAAVSPQDTQASNLLVRVLAPIPLPFVAGMDLAAQPRRSVTAQDTTSVAPILYQAPTLIPPPIVPREWTQRLGPVAQQDTQPGNLLIRLLAPTQGSIPVQADDWVQLGLRSLQAQDTVVSNVLLRDLPPAQLRPVAAEDFSQPIPRGRLAQIEPPPNLLLSTLSGPLPQVADDWTQVSVKRVHAQDTSSFNLVLRGIAPFVPTLIGNPRYIVQHLRARRFEVSSVSYLQFEPLDPAETVELTFNFVPDLPTGVTLTGTPTILFTLRSGVDASPSTSVPNGLAGFNQAFTQVIVPVRGTSDGNKYAIKVECATSDPALDVALTGILQIMEGA